MLYRFGLYYLLARGLPGLVNFLALLCYTRLLSAAAYGRYMMVVSGVGLLNVILFQWLKNVMRRYLPTQPERPGEVMRPVLGLFLAIAIVLAVVVIGIALVWPDPYWRPLIAISGILTVLDGWMDLNLSMTSAQLAPARYGYLMGLKSILALMVGSGLAYLGFGAYGPLIGFGLGIALSWLLVGWPAWRGFFPKWPNRSLLREYTSYGLPLVVSLALGWVITSSDRFFIAWILGEKYTGLYTVGYDLADQSTGLVMAIVNLASYPIVVHTYESEGAEAASVQLASNGELVVTLALTCSAGLIGLMPAIADFLIGSEFRVGTMSVLPWIAISSAVAATKTFHFDVAFHLSRQSRGLLVIGAMAALLNAILNLLLIPRFGIIGAAWATLAAFVLAALSSYSFGRKVFPMPALLPLLVKAFAVAGTAYLATLAVMRLGLQPVYALVFGLVAGGGASLAAALLFNVADIRLVVPQLLKRLPRRL